MKNFITLPLMVLGIILFSCSGSKHFISDENVRDQVNKQYEARYQMASNREAELFGILNDKSLSDEQKEAFKFLIAYMPLSDLADYSGEYFMDQINLAFNARETFNWGSELPEDIFRHFVLPVRVNNENLDTARAYVFRELKDRLINLSIEEAALEVNHWCHEKVNYKAGDARTSSPLATIKTSFGRCGEESTFTVAAMRAVSIPARQVYTPRWAHTDDNHAWVEVYVNGKWQYLGACEPEPVLNKGWFDAPVKRAMMVHTNVIGQYSGTENVLSQNDLFSKINSLPAYTDTKEYFVKVIDKNRNAVPDAKVEFGIYNYAEFYPMVIKSTDSTGMVSLLTGYGDLMVWSYKDNYYGYEKLTGGISDTILINLTRVTGEEYTEVVEIAPPAEKEVPEVSVKDTEKNNVRLAQEDSIRNAYMSTFITREDAKMFAVKEGLDTLRTIELLLKSYGNWNEICNYLKENKSNIHVLDLLESISEKDVRDTPALFLTDHLINAPNVDGISEEVYKEGVLSPRIYLELIRPWRSFLSGEFDQGFKNKALVDYRVINEWISNNIQLNTTDNYMGCSLSPIGVYKLRVADKLSTDIFFVAVCRTIGIPARIDYTTSLPQVYKDGNWQNVSVATESTVPNNSVLQLLNSNDNPVKPEYYKHYTVQRFENGRFKTLDYEYSAEVAEFPVTLKLQPGYYKLMTGHRREDGSIITRSEYFNLAANSSVTKTVFLQPLESKKEIFGTLDMALSITDQSGATLELSELANNKGLIIACIDPGSEPTRHLLAGIPGYKQAFEEWGGGFLFSVPGSTGLKSFNHSKYQNLPKQSKFLMDHNDKLYKAVIESMSLKTRPALPFVVYIDSDGAISFYSAGYRIGTEENLLKAIKNPL